MGLDTWDWIREGGSRNFKGGSSTHFLQKCAGLTLTGGNLYWTKGGVWTAWTLPPGFSPGTSDMW